MFVPPFFPACAHMTLGWRSLHITQGPNVPAITIIGVRQRASPVRLGGGSGQCLERDGHDRELG